LTGLNRHASPEPDDRKAARLGYGTSNLAGRLGRKESIRLLDAAFDAGIRHFDTAPMYGYGAAEGVLGEFLRTKRDQVTVTTKFGIEPPRQSPVMTVARNVAKAAVAVMPSLRKSIAQRAESMISAGNFNVPHATMSLRRSLTALKTDHIDCLLLHEPKAEQIAPELIEFLEAAIRRGEIGSYGVAATNLEMPRILASGKPFGTVAQFPEVVFEDTMAVLHHDHSPVVHSIFSQRLNAFADALRADKSLASRTSATLGFDSSDSFRLGRLFLWGLLQRARNGVVLFASLNPESIRNNAALQVESEFSLEQAASLESMLRANDNQAHPRN